MAKKYYWLKLKKDFMQGDVVDYLMSQSNGANYVVLYQMLCFMTLNTNGVMATAINEVILPYNIEKIQRDCKYFNEDTIVVALDLFKKLGLVYKNLDGMYQINEYEELVGSETTKAKLMRNLRKKEKINGNNVTKKLPQCYTEIEKDLDKDLEIEKREKRKEIKINKDKKNAYGEYQNVKLTEKEYLKLNADFNNVDAIIKFFDEYIEEKGYKSKSHNLAIRRWVAKAVEENSNRGTKKTNNNIFDEIGKEEGLW